MRQGLLILDSNCIGALESEESRRTLLANMKVARLDIAFSEINLLEVIAAPEEKRKRLLSVMLELEPDASLLPWPPRLLREIGGALLEDRENHEVSNVSLRQALDASDPLGELAQEARKFNAEVEAHFSAMHENMRRDIQRAIKDDRRAFDRIGVRHFIDQYWTASDLQKHVAEVI